MNVLEVKKRIRDLHLNGPDEVKGKPYGQLPSPFDMVPYCRSTGGRLNFMFKNFDFKNKKFLDLGCNAGHYCFALADVGADGIGVDNDENCITVANLVKMALGYEGVVFEHGDVIDYNHGFYDVIIFLSTFQWIAKMHGTGIAKSFLNDLSERAPVMFFETSGSDSKAPLPDADKLSWITQVLDECGWRVDVMEDLFSEVGGKRWMIKCLSKKY